MKCTITDNGFDCCEDDESDNNSLIFDLKFYDQKPSIRQRLRIWFMKRRDRRLLKQIFRDSRKRLSDKTEIEYPELPF